MPCPPAMTPVQHLLSCISSRQAVDDLFTYTDPRIMAFCPLSAKAASVDVAYNSAVPRARTISPPSPLAGSVDVLLACTESPARTFSPLPAQTGSVSVYLTCTDPWPIPSVLHQPSLGPWMSNTTELPAPSSG